MKLSDEFLCQLENIGNAMMDGKRFDDADSAIAGAMISVAVTELRDRRPAPSAAVVLWAECCEPPDGDGVPACGWTGEMSQLDADGSITHCPACGSTAIREDIDPNATKDPTP